MKQDIIEICCGRKLEGRVNWAFVWHETRKYLTKNQQLLVKFGIWVETVSYKNKLNESVF